MNFHIFDHLEPTARSVTSPANVTVVNSTMTTNVTKTVPTTISPMAMTTTQSTRKTTKHRTKKTESHMSTIHQIIATGKPIIEHVNTNVSITGNDGEIMLKQSPHRNEEKLHDDNRFNKNKHMHSNQDIELAHKRIHGSRYGNHPTRKMTHFATTVREFLRGELQKQPKGSTYLKALIHQLLEDDKKQASAEESGSGSGESPDSKAYHKSRVVHVDFHHTGKMHLQHHNHHKHSLNSNVHTKKHVNGMKHNMKIKHVTTGFALSKVDVDTIRAISPDTGEFSFENVFLTNR